MLSDMNDLWVAGRSSDKPVTVWLPWESEYTTWCRTLCNGVTP